MSFNAHEAADLLIAIEIEMRRAGLWESESPAPELLASPTPFCFDTLSCPQWLQWVFIPRMKEIIEADQQLPAECHIHPYAESAFEEAGIKAEQLLTAIQQFDEMCNESP